jgi:hypothetical protein
MADLSFVIDARESSAEVGREAFCTHLHSY